MAGQREIGPEEAKIRAQTRVGLMGYQRDLPSYRLVKTDEEPPNCPCEGGCGDCPD